MSDDMEKAVAEFAVESREGLDRLEADLLSVEADASARPQEALWFARGRPRARVVETRALLPSSEPEVVAIEPKFSVPAASGRRRRCSESS